MCGRFALGIPRKRLQERFELGDVPQAPARYNIAPSQLVEAVVQTSQGGRFLKLLKWGLVPFWVKDKPIGNKMINARSETVATNGAFKGPIRYRRCLIPAQGFYEWATENGKRQPWFITSRNSEVLALAGIWDTFESRGAGEVIESMAIITSSANELVAPLHDRMPVIVEPEDYARWLDPDLTDPDQVMDILASRPWLDMQAYRVGSQVNSPKNEDPALIEPLI